MECPRCGGTCEIAILDQYSRTLEQYSSGLIRQACFNPDCEWAEGDDEEEEATLRYYDGMEAACQEWLDKARADDSEIEMPGWLYERLQRSECG